MCEPTTIMMGVGLAISAMGAMQQAQGAQQSAEFNAQVAANNSITSRQRAIQEHDVGKVTAAKEALKARQLIGLQRATLAGNAVRVDAGSAADITADTQIQAQLDTATIRENSARSALGFLVQGANFDAQGGLILAEGSNRASAINSKAVGSLLTGAGSVASKWSNYGGGANFGATGQSLVPNAFRSTPPIPTRAPR